MRVTGEAQMPDASLFFLFHKIVQYAPAFIHIGLNRVLVNIMQEVEVKILHSAFLQLFFKYCRRVIGITDLMAGILGRQIEGFSRMPCQSLAQNDLRIAGMIRERRVKIIDSVFQCVVHHTEDLFFVDLRRIRFHHGKPHRTKSKTRQR